MHDVPANRVGDNKSDHDMQEEGEIQSIRKFGRFRRFAGNMLKLDRTNLLS